MQNAINHQEIHVSIKGKLAILLSFCKFENQSWKPKISWKELELKKELEFKKLIQQS